jgi:hypothetical protein
MAKKKSSPKPPTPAPKKSSGNKKLDSGMKKILTKKKGK